MNLKSRAKIFKNLRSLGCPFELTLPGRLTMMKSSYAKLSLDLFTFPSSIYFFNFYSSFVYFISAF